MSENYPVRIHVETAGELSEIRAKSIGAGPGPFLTALEPQGYTSHVERTLETNGDDLIHIRESNVVSVEGPNQYINLREQYETEFKSR